MLNIDLLKKYANEEFAKRKHYDDVLYPICAEEGAEPTRGGGLY